MTKVLKEIVSRLSPGDLSFLRSVPGSGELFVRGKEYDFAVNLYELGLVQLRGGLRGWSAYVSLTDRGRRVLEMVGGNR